MKKEFKKFVENLLKEGFRAEIEISVRDAREANDIIRDVTRKFKQTSSNSYVFTNEGEYEAARDALERNKIEFDEA